MNKYALRVQRTSVALVGFLSLGSLLSHAAVVPDTDAIARANNAFAVDLYGRLNSADGNSIFSPYSISLAFGMAGSGAGGNTADEMGKVLHFSGRPVEAAAGQGALQELLNTIESKGEIQLAIANSIWPERSYPLRQEYLDLLSEYFRVAVSACDFKGQPEAERRRINAWVEVRTNGKIQDLLPGGSVTPMTRLVLANAIYFKGHWESPFKFNATKNEPFFLQTGGQVNVSLMTQKGSFRYGQHPGLQVLSMPYAGGDLSMIVLLPEAKNGLTRLESDLSAEKLKEWTSRLGMAEVIVHFPKFKVESSFRLNGPMQALGMIEAFAAGRADFSPMSARDGLFISDAVHKAFIDVNEEGTEAAAATGIGVRLLGANTPPVVFRADHPFIYLIRHEGTGTILFLGRMMDPTQ